MTSTYTTPKPSSTNHKKIQRYFLPFGVEILTCQNVTVKSNSTAALALMELIRSHPYIPNLAAFSRVMKNE